MSEIKQQLRQIEDLRSLRYITSTLRDISVIEIKEVRERFDKNEQFASELRDLYKLVWRLAERAQHRSVQQHGARTLHVAFTTNRHFYGALNHDVMYKFQQDTDTSDSCLIIGDIGKEIWMSTARKRLEVSFISFAEDTPSLTEVTEFLRKTAEYTRVFMYYPGFVSVFIQKPMMLDITFRPQAIEPKSVKGNGEDQSLDSIEFLLEPDLGEMIDFFNSQVRYALFERMLLETQLSRIAARLVKMDTADQNADRLMSGEQTELRRAYASFSSRRMIETLVGHLQWHTQKI
jgi:ATP synthase F1 gamma subunit